MNNRNINRTAVAALALAISGAASAQAVVHDPVNAVAISMTSVQTTVNVEESIASRIIAGTNAATNAANAATNAADALTNAGILGVNTAHTAATIIGVAHQKEIEDAIRNLEFSSDDHFTYIENNNTTNNYYDEGGITLPPVDPTPIPFVVPAAGLAAHQDQFKSMEDYSAGNELVKASNQVEATAAVRETNATQLAFMHQQSEDLAGTIERLDELGKGMTDEKVLKSRNGQMQYANLIGLENTAQLVRLRQAMLVSENASNARAQLEADMQARQFANGARISETTELNSATTSW